MIDYRASRFEEKVKEVDAVIDTVGGEILDRSYGVVKRGGIIVSAAAPPPKKRPSNTVSERHSSWFRSLPSDCRKLPSSSMRAG